MATTSRRSDGFLDRLTHLLFKNGKKSRVVISAVYFVGLIAALSSAVLGGFGGGWISSSILCGFVLLLSGGFACLLLSSLRLEQVEEAYLRLATMVESSDDAIVCVNLDGEILTWNRGAEKTYAYVPNEVLGRSFKFLAPPEADDQMDHVLNRIRRGESIHPYETAWLKKDGSRVDVSLTVSAIRNASGEIAASCVVSRDITERMQQRRELQDKNRALEEQVQAIQEVNRLKSEFLANMSHELRTPLNAIIGFAQLMRDGRVGAVSENHKEYLGDILASGRRLLELVNDVLDLARVDSGKMQLSAAPVRLSPLIAQVQTILQNVAANKHVSIETEIAPQVEELVIDPAKLKQVLYHLLSNAIKFTPDGGRVAIRALAEDSQHFRLEVCDTGIGIPARQLDELFVEFKQLDQGLNKKQQGIGLGLALTKKIVEAQGGRVGVRTHPGQGSLFFAVLPKGAPQAKDGREEQGLAALAGAEGPRVLVVEDDEQDRKWLDVTLSQAGYVVDSATSGAEALGKAQTTEYSAILLDLILPDALGWDVLNSIRNAEKNQHAPVIAVTMVTEKSAAKSFALQDYLPKPVSASELLASLRRAGVIANGAGRRILVVDDDPQAIKLAAAALESSGYQVSCHSSAESALTAAAQQEIHAVVLDLLMPEMDGFEFLDRLRSLAGCKDTPVIIWTAKNITTEERSRLRSAASSIALKGQGGIDAVLRELRYHVNQGAKRTVREKS